MYREGRKANFNTSHVVVYPIPETVLHIPNPISIHLMLLFIDPPYTITRSIFAFQYISCCCLSFFNNRAIRHFKISIHLMLLFIFHVKDHLQFQYAFQYISCCCLSHTPNLVHNNFRYFNTSHVVVYQFIAK